VVGIEKFGMISLAQAFTSYLMVFTDYGFNLSATRDTALHKADSNKLRNILHAVFTTKLILSIISFIILLVVILLVPKFKAEWWLFVLSFTMVIGYVLQPVWFFQGMEQMSYIAYLNLLTKILFVGLVFIFIRTPADYIYANLFLGVGNIVSGLITLWVMYRKFGLTIGIARWHQVKHQLAEGWHIFLSNFSIHAYVYSNLFILGLFTNSTIVGYYSIAEKVIFAIRQLLSVFSQVIYPYICSLSLQAHNKIRSFFVSIYIPFALLIFVLSVLLYLFSGQVVLFLAGHPVEAISDLIKMLSFVPFIVMLNIPAYQTLLAYNFKQSYSTILVSGSILNIVLNIFLSYTFAASGTAMAVIITELFITAGLYIVLETRHSRYSLLIHSSQTL
jgi:PST family polysaccharide transporter